MSELFSLIRKLNLKADDFYSAIKAPDKTRYKLYLIDKKNRTKRVIEQPIDENLIKVQKALKVYFENEYYKYMPNSVHGFVKKRSIITNAQVHHKHAPKFILKIDIKDFFPSITYERLYEMFFKTFHLFFGSTINALCLAVTCNKHLPQGAATSPILANMICKRLDKKLFRLAKQKNAIYTRYADDVSISFSDQETLEYFIGSTFVKRPFCLNDEIIKIFEENGFKINDSKTKVLSNSTKQYVCGISINNKNGLSIKRSKLKEIRQEIFNLKVGKTKFNNKIVGKVAYLRSVYGPDNPLSIKYSVKLNECGKPVFIDSDFKLNDNKSYAKSKYIIAIDTKDNYFGTGFFANNFLITSKHVIKGSKYADFFTICYYVDKKMVKKDIFVKEIFEYGEIALINFEGIEEFKNRNLKLAGKIYDGMNKTVYTLGVAALPKTSFPKTCKKTTIIGDSDLQFENVYRLSDQSIYKGMSGGPVIELQSYKVIGVNFVGPSEKEDTEEYPRCLCSIIDKTIFKKMIKIK